MGTSDGDNEFEERFLQCFGLGNGDAVTKRRIVRRTDSEPEEEVRDKTLKEQSKNSPW